MNDTKSNGNSMYNIVLPQTQLEKYKYWEILRDIKKDFEHHHGSDLKLFKRYMKEHFGIVIELVDENIGPDYKVIDESKYVLFLLKYN
jgi:hypothetical protein